MFLGRKPEEPRSTSASSRVRSKRRVAPGSLARLPNPNLALGEKVLEARESRARWRCVGWCDGATIAKLTGNAAYPHAGHEGNTPPLPSVELQRVARLHAIPSPVTSIGGFAFLGCTSLPSEILPSSVSSVGEYAFSGCTSLRLVTIPRACDVGYKAFDNCPKMQIARV